MAKYIHHSCFFEGHEISEYGLKCGYVDYATLGKAFQRVLCNDIISATAEIGYWSIVNGDVYDEEGDESREVFQYFIISDYGARVLMDCTDEIVWYNDELDLYVWGVTHFGTGWSHVLTDIPIDHDPDDESESEG